MYRKGVSSFGGEGAMHGILCANCGAPNHIYKNCNHPITSFGVVCVRFMRNQDVIEPQYLMVQRKDSLSYGTFLRGKYRTDMRSYIMELFQNMTCEERNDIKMKTFEELWKDLWQITECNSFMREYEDAKRKFDILKRGFLVPNQDSETLFNIDFILDNTTPLYDETEWGFPKGRRNINEDDITCALREFSEETSIPCEHVSIMHPNPIDEVFIGGNRLRYRHVYYTCLLTNAEYMNCKSIAPYTALQKREIKKVEWFPYKQAQANIRDINAERKELFKCIHTNVMKYALSCVKGFN